MLDYYNYLIKPWCFPKPEQVIFVLSTVVNGKNWRITCTQKLTLLYALHTISRCKSRAICTHIEETMLT